MAFMHAMNWVHRYAAILLFTSSALHLPLPLLRVSDIRWIYWIFSCDCS